jgi:hypothetical protein
LIIRPLVTALIFVDPGRAVAQSASPLPVNCAAADSVLGGITAAQRKASVTHAVTAEGTAYARTGGQDLSASGLAVMARWTVGAEGTSLATQLDLSLPTAAFDRHWAARDSVQLVVDDWRQVPLGIPTPATVEGTVRPKRMLVSVALTEEDLRALAAAKSAVVRYGNQWIRFDRADLSATNRLYRLVTCVGSDARPSASRAP